MNSMCKVLALVLVAGLAVGSTVVRADDDSGAKMDALKQGQAELRAEVASLKTELAAIRGQLGQILAAVKANKAPKAPAAKRQRPQMEMLGKPGPQSSLKTYDGKDMKIGGKRDKPQVLYCYTSWCGYSKRAMPGLETLHQQYKDKGVEVVAVNLDDRSGQRAFTAEKSLETYNKLKLTLPMVMDNDKKVGNAYKARSFPTTYVLGTDGTVESVHVGAKAGLEKTIAAELDILLQGKTRADFPGAAPTPTKLTPKRPTAKKPSITVTPKKK